MSINQLIQISRSSFQSLDAAMNVVGQNIANVGSEGYARRRLTMRSVNFNGIGLHNRVLGAQATGTGAEIGHYERVRDGMLGRAAWSAQSGLGYAEEKHRILGAMEGLFPIDGGGLADQLDGFWSAWSDLSDNPLDEGARLSIRSAAQGLTGTLNSLDGSLAQFQEDTAEDLTNGVADVNALLEEIAALNANIATATHSGAPDFAAEDLRDTKIDELAAYVPVQVQESTSGFTITVNGITAVQEDQFSPLEIDDSGTAPIVQFADTGVALSTSSNGGKLGAWIDTLTNSIPDARTALDDLAVTLVTEVNALHQTGFGLDGTTGVDFFDPTGVTAASITVDAAILADADAIAASGDVASGGDNTIALAIAALRNANLMSGGTATVEDFATDLVAGIGAEADNALTQAEGQTAIVDHLNALAAGVSAVSLDDEMTEMIELQQAYAASARVLDAAQQMMDILLAL